MWADIVQDCFGSLYSLPDGLKEALSFCMCFLHNVAAPSSSYFPRNYFHTACTEQWRISKCLFTLQQWRMINPRCTVTLKLLFQLKFYCSAVFCCCKERSEDLVLRYWVRRLCWCWLSTLNWSFLQRLSSMRYFSRLSSSSAVTGRVQNGSGSSHKHFRTRACINCFNC
jgi:hypothetical protein